MKGIVAEGQTAVQVTVPSKPKISNQGYDSNLLNNNNIIKGVCAPLVNERPVNCRLTGDRARRPEKKGTKLVPNESNNDSTVN